MMKRFLTLLMVCFALPAFADDDALVRQISVRGEASRMVEPDQAVVSFTIESRDLALQRVKQMQDEKLQKLYLMAGELKIAKKDLKTQHARLQPEYRYDNGKRIFKGYHGSISIMISLDEILKAAEVMQALVDAGYDQINNIQYRMKDDQSIREELKLEALANAKAKAEKMAAALSMKVGAPIQIVEAGATRPQPQPMMMRAAADAEMALSAAPQAPPAGEQEIQQTMSVVFEMINAGEAHAD